MDDFLTRVRRSNTRADHEQDMAGQAARLAELAERCRRDPALAELLAGIDPRFLPGITLDPDGLDAKAARLRAFPHGFPGLVR
ncbi:hypothetical protein [Streptacidiphilus cavernicola]|uniref:Uncharacterized protein n=1 Tax=Streptacidiphilus cavernicola TaxID=3342716 RepID=A0ABV6VYI7_9ACTN